MQRLWQRLRHDLSYYAWSEFALAAVHHHYLTGKDRQIEAESNCTSILDVEKRTKL
jgi:DUF1680 family protein